MNIEKIIKEFDLKDLLFIPNRRWLVYILINKSEVVYIGKSDVNGYSGRLGSHKGKFTFTESRFIEVGESEQMALDIEKGLISACKPKHNTVHKDFCVRKVNGMFKCLEIIKSNLPKEVVREVEVIKEIEIIKEVEVVKESEVNESRNKNSYLMNYSFLGISILGICMGFPLLYFFADGYFTGSLNVLGLFFFGVFGFGFTMPSFGLMFFSLYDIHKNELYPKVSFFG